MLARLVAILRLLHREKINLRGMLALLQVAGQTLNHHNRRHPTISAVAKELEQTVSGASRVLEGLANRDGPAFITRQRGPEDGRTEVISLTEEGLGVVAEVIAELYSGPASSIHFKPRETIEELIAALPSLSGSTGHQVCDPECGSGGYLQGLRQVQISDEGRTLVLSPAEKAMSAAMRDWTVKHLSQPPEAKLANNGAELRFATRHDLEYFKFVWG